MSRLRLHRPFKWIWGRTEWDKKHYIGFHYGFWYTDIWTTNE